MPKAQRITRINKDQMEDDKKIKIKNDTASIICSDKLVNNMLALEADTGSATITKKKAKCSRKTVPRNSPPKRTSTFRGVTRHRWTGRYEAHLWDKNCWNQSQNKKGKQVYLGAYLDEEAAAHAYDLAALKYWGPQSILNFPLPTYKEELRGMDDQSREEYIGSLRRKSSGFSRGVSKYRGVARHHHNGRWEARIGRVLGNKYLYLGTFATQEEAATAYDMAAVEYRGLNAVTNFDLSRYTKWLSCSHQELNSDKSDNDSMSPNQLGHHMAADSSLLTCTAASPSDKFTSKNADNDDAAALIWYDRDTEPASPFILGKFIDEISARKTSHSMEENEVYNVYSKTPTSPEAARNSSGHEDDSRSFYVMNSKRIFPDEIQTFFEHTRQESDTSMCAGATEIIHIGSDDIIFGEAELNSFASSIFNFDQLHSGCLTL